MLGGRLYVMTVIHGIRGHQLSQRTILASAVVHGVHRYDVYELGAAPSRSCFVAMWSYCKYVAGSSPKWCMSAKKYRFVADTRSCGIADTAYRPRRESSHIRSWLVA